MSKSPAFIRIKADVLKIVSAIPPSRVTTFRSIGEYLDVMPRHVAYILTMLSPEEKNQVSWFRVVSDNANLGVPKADANGKFQAELLREEGILIHEHAIASDFARVFIPAEELSSGVVKQTRSIAVASTARLKPKLKSSIK
jgi:methylated-DNA-protein-cysteine methyltransferase related protein